MTTPPTTKPGRFISFEGGEGAGKSTVINAASRLLQRHGVAHRVTREPGGTPLGDALRQIVLDPRHGGMCAEAEALIMFASRAQHVVEIVRPALFAGEWVVTDRFADASYAYQSGGRGLAVEFLESLEHWSTFGVRPDLTVLLDVPVDEGMRRVAQRGTADRLERETVQFFERVRAAYLARAAAHADRFCVVDAGRPLEDVVAAVEAALERFVTGEGPVVIVPWLEHEWRALAARVAAGRVPHALLVAGPAGLGKRAFVDALAASLLCTARDANGHACDACRACRLLAAGSHPDRVHVTLELRDDGTPRTEIVVEQVRALGERLAKTSQFGGLQVATIDPADAFNTNAANALLKTLEEPSAGTVIVLVGDQPMRLPATIRSRCQRIDARFPAREAALAWLAAQGVARPDAEFALALAAGNPGVAAAFASPERRKLLDDVARDLTDLRARRARPTELTAIWLRESPDERLLLAAELARLLAWAGGAGGAGRLPARLAAHVGLTANVDLHKLAAWWDRANRVRLQLKTPLRADLLLLDVLRDWRDLARA